MAWLCFVSKGTSTNTGGVVVRVSWDLQAEDLLDEERFGRAWLETYTLKRWNKILDKVL